MRKDSLFVLFLSVLFIAPLISSGQRSTDSKFYWGGNLGLMFGTYTVIDVSPLVGYKVTEKFHVGTGLTYTYYKYSEDGTYNGGSTTKGFEFSTSIYGGRLFTRYYALENIFLHVEDELINFDIPFFSPFSNDVYFSRQWVNSVLVGAGYGYNFNVDGPSLSIAVLWRVNTAYEKFYPYQNPIIRVGLGFGF